MKRRFLVAMVTTFSVLSLLCLPFIPQASAETTWVDTGGPGPGLQVNALVYDGSRDILYAGIEGDRVYRCTSPGSSPAWTSVGGLMTLNDIESMAYDSANNVLYVGGEGTGTDHVWRLKNPHNSNLWQNITDSTWLPMTDYAITCLAYNETDNLLFASTQNGRVQRLASPDTTPPTPIPSWKIVGGPATWTNTISMGNSDTKLYIGMPSTGARRCENPNGSIPPAPTVNDMGGAVSDHSILNLDYDASNNSLFAATKESLAWNHCVYRCDNPEAASPNTWTDMNWPNPGSGMTGALLYSSTDDALFVGGNQVVRRCNEPATSPAWKDMTGNLSGAYIYCFAYDSASRTLFAGTQSDGVWRAIISPEITDISPSSGCAGDEITLTGENFGNTQGSGAGMTGGAASSVSFGSVSAASCSSWTDNEIKCTVPGGIVGDVKVTVVTDGGTSNEVDFTIDYPTEFYFAEGYTGTGFQEYLCLGNSGNTDANATVTFMFNDGSAPLEQEYTVPALSRSTVDVNSVADDKEVSIKVESESTSIVAERPMYFDYQGKWAGGHDSVAATSTEQTWYFAEGTTRTGFEEYITVLNPGGTSANLEFHYMVEGEGETVKQETVDANSRATFSAVSHVGTEKDISLMLSSDAGIVAERPMYFNYQGLAEHNWQGGHCVVGANAPDDTWYFAEGTTRNGFEEWLCMQNPGNSSIEVTARYMMGEGQGNPIDKTYTVPAMERLTKSVNDEIGPDKDVSVRLTSGSEFIAERPMYFDYQGTGDYGWDGGHDVLGANAAAKDWFFAEGYTGAGFEEWLCIQNPTSEYTTLGISYFPESGDPVYTNHAMEGNSRLTINVNSDAGPDLQISTRIEADHVVIVERPMYFKYAGVWPGGHDVIGFTP